MSANKSRKQLPQAPSPRVVTPPGEPVGAFLRTLQRAREAGLAIDPYDITTDLVLKPPNEARTRDLSAASAAHLLAQTAAVKLVQEPEPMPDPPRPLPDSMGRALDNLANRVKKMMSSADVDPGLIEEMIVAIRTTAVDARSIEPDDPDEYQQYLKSYEEYTKIREDYPNRMQRELRAIQAQSDEASDAYTQALIGDAEVNQRVKEFFAVRDEWEREAFVDAVTRQFLRLPDEGKCLACGHIDPKARSAAMTSAIGSNTTSTSSTATSPSTSEQTSTTGGAASDLGSSSPTTSTD